MCARTSCRKIIEAYVTKATVNRFVQSLSDEQTSRRHEDGKTLARSCRRRKAQRREDLTMGASASLHIENSVAQVLGNLIDTNVENMSNEDAVQEVRQLRHLLNNLAFHEKQDKLKAELSLPIDASDLSGEDLAANTAEVIRIRTLLNEYLFLETLRTYGSLHEACRQQNLEAIKTLLNGGIDVNIAEKDGGRTALYYAAFYGFDEIILFLHERGANLDQSRSDGMTPLGCAILRGYSRTVNLLLQLGANIEKSDKRGWTPIMFASFKGRVNDVEMLLNWGANFSVFGEDGESVFHCAVLGRQRKAIASLYTHSVSLSMMHSEASPIPDIKKVGDSSLSQDRLSLETVPLPPATPSADTISRKNSVTTKSEKNILHTIEAMVQHKRSLYGHTLNTTLDLFQAMDKDHSDYVSKREMRDALRQLGLGLSDKQVQDLMEHMHFEENHHEYGISYREFANALHGLRGFRRKPEDPKMLAATVIQSAWRCYKVPHPKNMSDYVPLYTTLTAICENLHKACDKLQQIQYFNDSSKHIATIDTTNHMGWTPLNLAVHCKDLPMVEALVELGADINEPTNALMSPLSRAIELDHVDIITFLRRCGGRRYSTVWDAAKGGDVDELKWFIKSDGAPVDALTEDLYTPLHFAAKHGHLQATQFLLSLKATVNLVTITGETPLYLASMKNHSPIMKLLYRYGAIIEPQDFNESHQPLYPYYTRKLPTYSPMKIACKNGQAKAVNLLLQLNPSAANERDDIGRSMLHIAAERGHIDVVKLLIDANANVNAITPNKYTPLMASVAHGHVEVVELLLTADADCDLISAYGMTALDYGIIGGIQEIQSMLRVRTFKQTVEERPVCKKWASTGKCVYGNACYFTHDVPAGNEPAKNDAQMEQKPVRSVQPKRIKTNAWARTDDNDSPAVQLAKESVSLPPLHNAKKDKEGPLGADEAEERRKKMDPNNVFPADLIEWDLIDEMQAEFSKLCDPIPDRTKPYPSDENTKRPRQYVGFNLYVLNPTR